MNQLGFDCTDLPSTGAPELSQIIDQIGKDGFHGRLLSYLHETIGAEHCATFVFGGDGPTRIGAFSFDRTDAAEQQSDLYVERYWRLDPTVVAARSMTERQTTSLMRLDVNRLPPSGLRDLVYRKTHICERLLLCGYAAGSHASLSILRSEESGKFSDVAIARLSEMASTLLSIVGKHTELVTRRSDISLAFSSLEMITECMASAPEGLPRRELEVCALILFGVSSLGISLELNIGEETVKTYRKRAYQRLGIATQHELLVWYINHWGSHGLRVN